MLPRGFVAVLGCRADALPEEAALRLVRDFRVRTFVVPDAEIIGVLLGSVSLHGGSLTEISKASIQKAFLDLASVLGDSAAIELEVFLTPLSGDRLGD